MHWFTADWHIGHNKVIEFCQRPFSDIDEMENALRDNWNDRVAPDDICWVLGDLSIDSQWKRALEFAKTLKGRKRLIMGNHDKCWTGKRDFLKFMPDYLAVFETAVPFARVKFEGVNYRLSHFPYAWDDTDDRHLEYRLPAHPGVLLCGHVHEKWKVKSNEDSVMVNVGVDQWGFTPVDIETVADFAERNKK